MLSRTFLRAPKLQKAGITRLNVTATTFVRGMASDGE